MGISVEVVDEAEEIDEVRKKKRRGLRIETSGRLTYMETGGEQE